MCSAWRLQAHRQLAISHGRVVAPEGAAPKVLVQELRPTLGQALGVPALVEAVPQAEERAGEEGGVGVEGEGEMPVGRRRRA